MNLLNLFCSIQNALTIAGWQSDVEDDYSDLKQLSCKNLKGPLGVFTRLDVIVMTPERNSDEASGICICFLFYADPTKVADMFQLGKLIRQDESHLLRSQCDSIFNAAKIHHGNPSIKVSVRPKLQKIKFSEENIATPAFMVELGYWLSREKFPSERKNSVKVAYLAQTHDEQINDTRIEAIYALRGIEIEENEELLLEATTDTNPQIRIAGLTVLSEYCDYSHLSLFEDALNDTDETVRRFAGEYLKTYRKHIRSGPVINTKQSVSNCLHDLTSTNDAVRSKAVSDLEGVTDPQIIQPLLAIMKGNHDGRWCRWAAMNVLDKFNCPELLDEFYSILGDEQIGAEAAYKLGGKSDPIAHDMLRKALFSENRIARLSAAHGISFISVDDNLLLQLCIMIDDDDLQFKRVALSSLSGIFSRMQEAKGYNTTGISEETKKHVVDSLVNSVRNENEYVRGESLDLLCDIDKCQAVTVVSHALEEFVTAALDKKFKVNKDPWEFDVLHFHLLTAINKLGIKVFQDNLRRLCNTKNWRIKFDAINMLLSIGDTSGVSVLERALDSKDWMIRVNAAESLLKLGDCRAWDILARALADDVFDDFWVKAGIVDVLANSGDVRTFDLFIDMLNDVDTYSGYDEIIAKIITWMGNYGDPRAKDPIKKWQYKELINCDADVVEKALRSLNENKQKLADIQI